MQIKPMAVILTAAGVAWLGSMVWLTGYRQGYDEGSTTAWNQTRTAPTSESVPPLPDSVELTGR